MTKHRLTNAVCYKTWTGMRQRCNNPRNKGYHNYGGRGIKVCERWNVSFEAFWADMGPTWSKGLTLERIDCNGDYEPSNCKWIPRADQPKNTRACVFIETPWGRMTLAEAGRRIGVEPATFWMRYKNGWRGEKLFQPPHMKGGRVVRERQRAA